MGMIDDAIVSVEKWARREFPHYLGEDVGNALATYLDFELTLGQGILAGGVDLVEGIGQFDPLRFAYDPEGATQTWVGMAESLGEGMLYATPTGVLANPAGAFNHWKDQVTDAVHAGAWSSDRPGYGLGKILFDVGASVVPGGPALRTTKVAAEAVDAATPSPGRIPGGPGGLVDDLAPIGQRADDITTRLNNLGDNIPTTPTVAGPNGPAVPPSLTEPPSAPRVGDTPTPTPRAPDAPAPHVPDSTPSDRTPPPPHDSTPTATPHAPDAPVDRTPTTPHSPTPAGTPAHTPAADQPAGGPAFGSDVIAKFGAVDKHYAVGPCPHTRTIPVHAGTPNDQRKREHGFNPEREQWTQPTANEGGVGGVGPESARHPNGSDGSGSAGGGPNDDFHSAHDTPVNQADANGPGHDSCASRVLR